MPRNLRQPSTSSLYSLMTIGALGMKSDGQLLDLFRSRRDSVSDDAFRVLLERHGPMVLGVCLSIVRDASEADDAFQATFLVLVQKADSIRNTESLSPWLHGVAVRVARRARAKARTREDRFRTVDQASLAEQVDRRSPDSETSAMIHREIQRLPERYRIPLILCCLQGQSYEQAARMLGLSEPSLRGRLHRGRKTLEARLRNQADFSAKTLSPGFLSHPPTAGLVKAVFALATRSTAISGFKASTPTASVVSLVKGASLAMALSSLKAAIVPCLATVCILGTVVLAQNGASLTPKARQEVIENEERQAEKPATVPEQPAKPKGPPTEAEINALNEAILAELAKPHDFDFPDGIAIEDLLRHIRKISSQSREPGIPIYVNPMGLSHAKIDMTASAPLTMKGQPLGIALNEYLSILKLGFVVRDGFLMIDSQVGALQLRMDTVEKKLDRLIRAIEPKLIPLEPKLTPN